MPYRDDMPTLSEFDGIRYLHFGTKWVQGAMRISRPNQLVLDYTRQMMAWLLFADPQPTDTVGILGLGAGALLKYTLAHTPAQVETVEWNDEVTAICRAYFRLPDSPRSTIIHADAAEWVAQPANIGRCSALLVDLYDADAQGPVRSSAQFYADCRRVLTSNGVLVVNLFGNHQSFPENIDNLRQAFGKRLLQLPQTPAGNRIVFGFAPDALQQTSGQLLERAEHVAAHYRLPAVRWARSLLDRRLSVPLGSGQTGISLEA